MRVLDRDRSLFANAVARQAGVLIGLQSAAMLSSLCLTVMIARGLDVAEYGTYRYVVIFLALGMSVLNLGVPYSAARLLALESQRETQKALVGACVVFVALGAAGGTVLVLVVDMALRALGHQLPQILVWVAPALLVTLGQLMIGNICRGLNRIFLLSAQQVLPYVILLPVTAVQIYVLHKYSLLAAIVGYVATFLVVISLGFFQLGASLTAGRSRLLSILKENRGTGFPIYVGGVFGIGAVQFVALWAAEHTTPTEYGLYGLALAVAAPLGVLMSSVGTVVFRSSSRRASLSKGVIWGSLALGIAMALVYLAGVEYLLVWAFGYQYAQAVFMAQVLGLGSLLVGWGDILQRFLGAHGLGRPLGMVAVCTGMVGIVAAAVLLDKWAAYGAITATILAAVTYFSVMIGLYAYYTRKGTLSGMEHDSASSPRGAS